MKALTMDIVSAFIFLAATFVFCQASAWRILPV